MKKILVDLDDVLSIDAYLNMMNDILNKKFTYDDINDYYIENILTKEELIEYRKAFRKGNVYDYASVAERSKEVLMRLMLDYEIYICSSFYSELDKEIFPEMLKHKCDFVLKNYPYLDMKNFIFTNNKQMIDADIRIDDRIDNLKEGSINLLYTAYHNKDIDAEKLKEKNIIRVNNWSDIEDKLINKNYLQTK